MTVWEEEDQTKDCQLEHTEASGDRFYVKIPCWFQGQNSIGF